MDNRLMRDIRRALDAAEEGERFVRHNARTLTVAEDLCRQRANEERRTQRAILSWQRSRRQDSVLVAGVLG